MTEKATYGAPQNSAFLLTEILVYGCACNNELSRSGLLQSCTRMRYPYSS
jgi:hypothetical protein